MCKAYLVASVSSGCLFLSQAVISCLLTAQLASGCESARESERRKHRLFGTGVFLFFFWGMETMNRKTHFFLLVFLG